MKATTRSRQCFCRSDIEKSMVSPLLLASGGLASVRSGATPTFTFSASWPEVGKILKRHRHAKRVMPGHGKAAAAMGIACCGELALAVVRDQMNRWHGF